MQMRNRTQGRLVGVDVARAVALIGMICAHLTYPDGVLAEVLYGFPSALFAFLAGVSMSLMARSGARPAHFVVRGLLLIALSFLLSAIPTQIVIVLGTLGACMIALAWAQRLPSRWLLALAAVMTAGSGVVPLFVSPPLMWAVLMVAGMLFHRHLIDRPNYVAAAAAVGGAVMTLDIVARWYADLPYYFTAQGHTGGLVDVVGSAGASISICSLSCLVARPRQLVLPRMGRMPLTLYCLHIPTSLVCGAAVSVIAAAVIATAWLAAFPRGPVEEAMRRAVSAGVGLIDNLERNYREKTSLPAARRERDLRNSSSRAGDGVDHVRRRHP
ncbi:heparan-alpha-glucosaminide N-acetyltransferase domain-containing protein [Corynebacterium sp. Q4381]|uniref:heparan-alpha-glucosaminide N-acetyltransferase domain-containing protein n=1 Tax=Corynebacterium sp. Marseille-Q4381 TaxID=3121597 RepID=UPI002FE61D80